VNDQLLIEVIHGGHDAILEFLFGCNASGAPELIRSGSRGRIRTTIGYELEAGALEKHAGPAFLATINDGLLGSCATLDVFQEVKVQLAGPRPQFPRTPI
jgi:hypothetical protein